MSLSEVTVLKMLGREAEVFFRSCCQYHKQRVSSCANTEISSDDWPNSLREQMDNTIETILGRWTSPSIVFASKFIDNDSIAGSQIHNIYVLLNKKGEVQVGILATEKYVLFYLKPDSGTPKLLDSLSRNKIFQQKAERMLWLNLLEACKAWDGSVKNSLVVAVDKALGPSRSDDEILQEMD